MTEKRYSLVYYADKGGAFIKDNENDTEWYHDSRASLLEIVDKLNELNDKIELIEIDKRNLHRLDSYNHVKILELRKENHELQERNNRQCKQLDDLYRLIEEKDWRALSDIIDDFKKSDELLQKEWSNFE